MSVLEALIAVITVQHATILMEITSVVLVNYNFNQIPFSMAVLNFS